MKNDLRRAVVIMAKEPRVGKVKTRLAGVIGAKNSASLYRSLLRDVTRTSSDRAMWTLIVAHHPQEITPEFREITRDADEWVPQIGGDLGERMAGVFRNLLTRFDAVVLRGSDSPTVPRERLAEAFECLQRVNCVLGPDEGGGYYLVGLKAPAPELFELPMSTKSNFDRTRERARELGLTTEVLTEQADVDTPEDLERLRKVLAAKPLEQAHATTRWLAENPPR